MKKMIWHCYKTKKVIGDGCGHVQISWLDLSKHQKEIELWNKSQETKGELSLEEVSEYPNRAPWKAVLTEVEPDGEFYAIPVEKLRTEKDCIRWTHHLLGKNWIDETDWVNVLSRFCGY